MEQMWRLQPQMWSFYIAIAEFLIILPIFAPYFMGYIYIPSYIIYCGAPGLYIYLSIFIIYAMHGHLA
jgi:hypothetical protein